MTVIPNTTLMTTTRSCSHPPTTPADIPTRMNTTPNPAENSRHAKKTRTSCPARRSSSCSADSPEIIER